MPSSISDLGVGSSRESNPASYVVLLSGTHVMGKDALAVSLANSLNCPWIQAEMAHTVSRLGANSQARKGYNYSDVFGRIWLSKLQRLGFPSTAIDSYPAPETEGRESDMRCAALITCYGMHPPARDAMRQAMVTLSVKPIFVIMQITKETLSGRTLGAEEPELAERIMGEKIRDIEEPLEEETDVIVLDSMRDVESLFVEVTEGISRQLADMMR